MSNVEYYLIHPSTKNPSEEFEKLVSALHTISDVKIKREGDTVSISYEKAPYLATLQLLPVGEELLASIGGIPREQVRLTCEQVDNLTINLLKGVLPGHGLGYRFFSPTLKSFLPADRGLFDLSTGVLDEKISKVFSTKGYRPIFRFADSLVFYAQSNKDSNIHVINSYLLEYFLNFGIEEKETPEFSYRVAPNLSRFIPMYDSGIVPAFFYDYYRRSTKIINHSGFNIRNPGRKVFVKPFIFELDEKKQTFDLVAAEEAALHYADKIRRGEAVDDTIKRILRDLKIADDYIGARVDRAIEFDRDKEGILTPRLKVLIYIERLNPEVKESIKAKSQRSWVPLEQARKARA